MAEARLDCWSPKWSRAMVEPGATVRLSTGTTWHFRWRSKRRRAYLTVAPGSTIALLHFGLQQSNRASAIASASHLDQLPPEALAGLSASDTAAIQKLHCPARRPPASRAVTSDHGYDCGPRY